MSVLTLNIAADEVRYLGVDLFNCLRVDHEAEVRRKAEDGRQNGRRERQT